MFRLDHILEQWARLYQQLQHTDANPTFFRISSINAKSYFVANFAKMSGSCCCYATHIDAEMAKQTPKAISRRHNIYMLVKQQAATIAKTSISQEEDATEARYLTDEMTQDLLAVLFAMKQVANGKALAADVAAGLPAALVQFINSTAADAQYREGLRGLDLENANWGTLPTEYNGWHICGITIEQLDPRILCINPQRYTV